MRERAIKAGVKSERTVSMTRRVLAGALALLLSACVVLPQTREVYDSECQVLRRQITLEVTQLQGFQRCYGDACAVLLVAASAVTLASLVVSGSIAVVGNAVYWAERPGNCRYRPLPDRLPERSPDRSPDRTPDRPAEPPLEPKPS
jgi:hypothetical protein